jgi:hypothetical protein
MEDEYFVIGFKDDPKNMKVIRALNDEIDEVVKYNRFTIHYVEEACDYCEYIVITVFGTHAIDAIQFEDKRPAMLNMNLRSDNCFLYDIEADKFIDAGILLWKDRDKAKNSKQAMKYVASRLSELFYSIDAKEAAELTEYTEKFNVPLNLDMYNEFQKVFKTEHPNWNSSDGRCPW